MKENFIVLRSYENGRVVKAAEKESGRKVAVKRWEKTEAQSELCKREEKVLSLLRHNAIPKFVYTFEDERYSYMVSEWIEGDTLDSYVKQKGTVSVGEAERIIKKVYRILCYLHSHPQGPFIYGDLKPSNILLANETVYLVDFESVKILTAAERNNSTAEQGKTVVLGTACFTAPEVFWGKPCRESDYYSLGALYYYMLTGSYWTGTTPQEADGRTGKILRYLLHVIPEKRKTGIGLLLKKESETQFYDTNLMPAAVAEKKIVLPSFRRQMLYVEENPCFGTELAYEAVKHFKLRVGVFAVSETDRGALHSYLDEKTPADGLYGGEDPEGKEILFRAKKESWLQNGYLKRHATEPLYWSDRPLEQICRDTEEEKRAFAEWALRNFDLTIVLGTGRSDGETEKWFMRHCDYVIAAPEANLVEVVCSTDRFAESLKKGMAYSVKYVAWEFKKGLSLPEDGFAKIVGKDNFLGPIMYDGERLLCENRKKEKYYTKMPEQIRRQYYSVMVSLWGKLEDGWERLQ